jgi:hypothetical protein
MSREQILHSDLAQIREDLRPIGVRTWAEATVPRVQPWLTPPVHTRSRTRGRGPPVRRVVPIKQPRALTIPPRALTSPVQAKDHRNSPRAHRATSRQAFRASAAVASSPQSRPSHANPWVSFTISPWSFPSPRTRQNFTRSPRSPSSDFGRPPPRVDRAFQ